MSVIVTVIGGAVVFATDSSIVYRRSEGKPLPVCSSLIHLSRWDIPAKGGKRLRCAHRGFEGGLDEKAVKNVFN